MKVSSITITGLALVGMSLTTAAHAHSDEIRCGTTYVVEKADSLSNISEWAYGTSREFQRIHQANIDTIGRNPGNISVGMSLFIPCLEEETPAVAEAEDADSAVDEAAAEAAVEQAEPEAEVESEAQAETDVAEDAESDPEAEAEANTETETTSEVDVDTEGSAEDESDAPAEGDDAD